MARRKARRFSRGNREYVWTSVVIDETDATGTPGAAVIVSAADWFGGAGGRHCTVLRVRGWLCARLTSIQGFANAESLYGYVAKFKGDETAESPLTPDAYTDEDVVWTFGGALGNFHDTANGVGALQVWNKDVDIKAKRRLSTDEQLTAIWVLESSSGSRNVQVNGVMRALLQLS